MIDRSKSVLGKSIDDLTLEDLKEFFKDEKIETSTLEFKSGGTEGKKLYKEIVGMLNCEGGIIILGAPIEISEDTRTKFKVCKGDLTKVTKFKNNEALAHSINSNINEIPIGIKVHPIKVEIGFYIYIIEVPKSNIPPHQVAQTGTYYVRINGESIPAPHGIVESLFNRRRRPELKVNLLVDIPFNSEFKNPLNIKFLVTNSSEVTADDTHILVEFYWINKFKKPKHVYAADHSSVSNFRTTENWSTPLVLGLTLHTSLIVDLKYEYLVLSLGYWCRNTALKTKHFLISKQSDFAVIIEEVQGNGKFSKDAGILADLMKKGLKLERNIPL